MDDVESMKKKVQEWPANQWFSMEDITGGEHSPGLWMHLCYISSNYHAREDGASLTSNTVNLKFMWRKKV